HLLTPPFRMSVLSGDLIVPVLTAFRLDNPHRCCDFVAHFGYKVRVVEPNRSSLTQILETESGEPLCKFCECLDILGIMHELGKLFLKCVEARYLVEDRVVGVAKTSTPDEGAGIGKT